MERVDTKILRLVAGCPSGVNSTLIAIHCFFDDCSAGEVLEELVSRGALLQRIHRMNAQGMTRNKPDQIVSRYYITKAGMAELERHE